jgi:4-hydroxymandelate oxidase
MTLPPLDELVNPLEVEDVARGALSRAVYDRVAQGAGAGLTLRRNREAFDRIIFRPRVLIDVSRMDLSTELFGQKLYAPILVAPMARQGRVHADAELATAQGAGAAQTILVVSRAPSVPFEQIAKRATAPLWTQSPAVVAFGAQAIVVSAGPDFDWATLERLRKAYKVPVLIKGVLSPDQAANALDRGAQGLIVSNHGGKILDSLPATIEVLPKIADTVAGRVPILVDGGFRRGTDILKALALGARAVLVGRPVLYGLGAYGADGVRAVLTMLQSELALAMGLCGKSNLAALGRDLVKIHRQ